MIVFRCHENQPIATLDCYCELRVFHLLAGIIEPHRKSACVDQFRFHAGTLLRLFEYQMRDVFALPPRRAVPRITGIKSGRSIFFGQNLQDLTGLRKTESAKSS
jgi:hypothetical protein